MHTWGNRMTSRYISTPPKSKNKKKSKFEENSKATSPLVDINWRSLDLNKRMRFNLVFLLVRVRRTLQKRYAILAIIFIHILNKRVYCIKFLEAALMPLSLPSTNPGLMCCDHFCTNTLGKVMNSSRLPTAMGYIKNVNRFQSACVANCLGEGKHWISNSEEVNWKQLHYLSKEIIANQS